MKSIGLFLSLLLLQSIGDVAAADDLQVCLAQIKPATHGPKSRDNPRGREQPYRFIVAIAGTELFQNSRIQQCIKSPLSRIPIVITNNNERVESFFINAADFTGGACLWYMPLKDSWQVWKQADSNKICQRNKR